MNKSLNTIILALGAGAMLGTTGLYAQSTVAKVPFDFTVQSVTLPAGPYALKSMSPTSGTIQIVNLETRKSIMVMAVPSHSAYAPKSTDTGKLTFHRYGDRYFFSEVWTPNGPRGRVAPSKVERELKANGGEQMASVGIPLAAQ
jgi:hypothetical protein